MYDYGEKLVVSMSKVPDDRIDDIHDV